MPLLLALLCLAGVTLGLDFTSHTHGLLNSQPRITCTLPFKPVVDRCIFADYLITGTWEEMRSLCLQMGGDLLGLQDANTLADVVDYLKENSLAIKSYWVGANDIEEEGVWRWINDNSPVHMATPLWGDTLLGGLEPMGGEEENCAAILLEDLYFMFDLNCNLTLPLMCERQAEAENGQIITQEADQLTRPEPTVAQCTAPYVNIGDRCLFVLSPSNGTWDEMKDTCVLLGGRMAKVDDANLLGAIYDFLVANDLTDQHIYVGGSDLEEEGHWVWLDGTPVRMGTPFWGNEEMEGQEPMGGTLQNCLILATEDYFFFHDFGCGNLLGTICEMV